VGGLTARTYPVRMFAHMMQSAKSPLLLLLAIGVLLEYRCHADSLLGLWQTETNHWSDPGGTNKVEAVKTIEFFRDHSFKIAEIAVLNGKRWTNVSFAGAYVILGTNRASLKLIPQNIVKGSVLSIVNSIQSRLLL
jgi:hypothetical protein